MANIDPKDLQFVADRNIEGIYSYKGLILNKIAIQRASRFRPVHNDNVAHEVFYSSYHHGIVYNYWPGARFFFVIAPQWDMKKYVNYFIEEPDSLKSRLWRKLHKYDLV